MIKKVLLIFCTILFSFNSFAEPPEKVELMYKSQKVSAWVEPSISAEQAQRELDICSILNITIPQDSESAFILTKESSPGHKAIRTMMTSTEPVDYFKLRKLFPKESKYVEFVEVLKAKQSLVIPKMLNGNSEQNEHIKKNIEIVFSSCTNGRFNSLGPDLVPATSPVIQQDGPTKDAVKIAGSLIKCRNLRNKETKIHEYLMEHNQFYARIIKAMEKGLSPEDILKEVSDGHFRYHNPAGLNTNDVYKFSDNKENINIPNGGKNPRVHFYYDIERAYWVLVHAYYKDTYNEEIKILNLITFRVNTYKSYMNNKPQSPETPQITGTNVAPVVPEGYKTTRTVQGMRADFIAEWNNKYELLKEFIRINNRLPLQKDKITNATGEEISIGTWLMTQRQAYRKEKLTADKINKLSELPGLGEIFKRVETAEEINIPVSEQFRIVPDVPAQVRDPAKQKEKMFQMWKTNYDATVEFIKLNNRFPVREDVFHGPDGEIYKVGVWFINQKHRGKIGSLSDIQKKLLLELSRYFQNNPEPSSWLDEVRRIFDDLSAYKGETVQFPLSEQEKDLLYKYFFKNHNEVEPNIIMENFRSLIPGYLQAELYLRSKNDNSSDINTTMTTYMAPIKTPPTNNNEPPAEPLGVAEPVAPPIKPIKPIRSESVTIKFETQMVEKNMIQRFLELLLANIQDVPIPVSDRIVENIGSKLSKLDIRSQELLYNLILQEYSKQEYCAVCASVTGLMASELQIPRELWELTINLLDNPEVDNATKDKLANSILSPNNRVAPTSLLTRIMNIVKDPKVLEDWEVELTKLENLPTTTDIVETTNKAIIKGQERYLTNIFKDTVSIAEVISIYSQEKSRLGNYPNLLEILESSKDKKINSIETGLANKIKDYVKTNSYYKEYFKNLNSNAKIFESFLDLLIIDSERGVGIPGEVQNNILADNRYQQGIFSIVLDKENLNPDKIYNTVLFDKVAWLHVLVAGNQDYRSLPLSFNGFRKFVGLELESLGLKPIDIRSFNIELRLNTELFKNRIEFARGRFIL